MSRPAPEIRLSTEKKENLLRWMRSSKTELRLVERARVILLASSGLSGKEIALKMKTREARISKWLRRFAQDRMAGLSDRVRSGEKRRKYTSLTEERILKALDEPAPPRLQPLEWAATGEASGQCEQGPSLAGDAKAHPFADLSSFPKARQM